MKTFCHFLILSTLLVTTASLQAQPPVIDESDSYRLAQAAPENDSETIDAASVQDEEVLDPEEIAESQPLVQAKSQEGSDVDNENLTDQIHSLQSEIQELRGQIEVQAHDLKMLQQQLAFYKDLDNRLQKNQMSAAQVAPNETTDSTVSSRQTLAPSKTKHNPADEQISYLAAYDLIKTKQFDQALIAMQQFIERYPESGYSANAHYWLGELYLVQKNNDKALQAFNFVLTQYPQSSKTAASELKAGYALVNLGKTEDARKKLMHVMNQYPDTKTAQLAKQKLQSIN